MKLITVKCLNELQKRQIAAMYVYSTKTVKHIASEYGVSARTIGRVLEEQDVKGSRQHNPNKVAPVACKPCEISPGVFQTLCRFVKKLFGFYSYK